MRVDIEIYFFFLIDNEVWVFFIFLMIDFRRERKSIFIFFIVGLIYVFDNLLVVWY